MADNMYRMIAQKESNEMYQMMWKMFQNGQITHEGWITFCNWYMWECVMVQPEVVEIMVRMKYN